MTQPLAASSDQSEKDWEFCVSALEEVSRSFATPIALLPPTERVALTLAYLLCRVADTIEDCTGVPQGTKDEIFDVFHRVLRGQTAPETLSRRFLHIETSDSEKRLMQGLARVMAVFEAQPPYVRNATVRWVAEMADGMRLYGRRAQGSEFFSLMNIEDLERYCYFVAGTVGHLITDLFVEAMERPEIDADLRRNAESFGLGLQMVNIVKDVTDDFARGVSYLPRQYCLEEGFDPDDLLTPECRLAAHRVVARVIERAGIHLDAALEYVLTIPPEHHRLRLFCLLPLWMAVETLALARENDAIFEPESKVKISREAVGRIIADCGRDCRDDDALRDGYAQLQTRSRKISA